MIPDPEPQTLSPPARNEPAEWEVEALLRLDAALAAGHDAAEFEADGTSLANVHACQRLLEAIFPRNALWNVKNREEETTRRFGKYGVLRELGRGGFGVVFLAEDPDLKRLVAVKVPRPEFLAAPAVRRRFLNEAQACGRFDHAGIVPVFAIGSDGPVCYIVSAYCEGPTLAQWLRSREALIPARLAAGIVLKVAEAIQHAHSRGILHRDLKPSNILLQPITDGDLHDGHFAFRPRVCDFGLARLLDVEANESMSGMPIGSPGYMAPEQAEGRNRDLGAHTDVHALGTILYEILIGQPPFRGETPLETIRLVASQTPVPPRRLRHDVPAGLEAICLKCLEKIPANRYDSAQALVEDLNRYLFGRRTHARSSRILSCLKSRRVLVAFAVIALCAFILRSGVVNRPFSSGDARQAHPLPPAAQEEISFLAKVERGRASTLIANVNKSLNSPGKVTHAYKTLFEGEEWIRASELEGFAGRYLLKRFSPSLTRISLPEGSQTVTSLAISSDSRLLAAGESGGRVVVFDLKTSAGFPSLPPLEREISSLAFSRDAQVLAISVASPAQIQFVNPERGRVLGVTNEQPGTLLLTLFRDDADQLVTLWATSSPEPAYEIRLWNIPSDGNQHPPTAILPESSLVLLDKTGKPTPQAINLSLDPKLRKFLEQFVRLHDLRTLIFRPEHSEATLFDRIRRVRLGWVHRGTGNLVASFRPDGEVTGDEIDRIGELGRIALNIPPVGSGDVGPVLIGAYSPDGSSYAAQYEGLPMTLYSCCPGHVLASLNLHDSWHVADARFTPDGKKLAFSGPKGSIVLWTLETRELLGHFPYETWSLAYSPDGKTLASAGDDHRINLWDAAKGQLLKRLEGHKSLVTSIAFTPDGRQLLSAGFDKKVRIWDALTGKLLATLDGHTKNIRALALSPDGKTIATTGDDKTVRLWDLPTRTARTVVPIEGSPDGTSIAFSPDGHNLALGGGSHSVTLIDPATGAIRRRFDSKQATTAIAYSPNGSTLVYGDAHGMIVICDPVDGHPRFRFMAHPGGVLGLAFSPGGKCFASVGRDKSARVWDTLNSRELLELKGHEHQVHGVAFSPSGNCLATAGHDGPIKLWWADPNR